MYTAYGLMSLNVSAGVFYEWLAGQEGRIGGHKGQSSP